MKKLKRGNLAIVSSGDPEKDRRRLEQAELHESRIRAGLCPNGCGSMEWSDLHNATCKTCGFEYFTALARVPS